MSLTTSTLPNEMRMCIQYVMSFPSIELVCNLLLIALPPSSDTVRECEYVLNLCDVLTVLVWCSGNKKTPKPEGLRVRLSWGVDRGLFAPISLADCSLV